MIFFIVTPFADAHGRGDGFGGFLKLRVSKMWWSGGEHTRASIFLLSPITQKRGVRSQNEKRNALFQRIIAPARVSLLPCCDVEKKMCSAPSELLLGGLDLFNQCQVEFLPRGTISFKSFCPWTFCVRKRREENAPCSTYISTNTCT